MSQENVEFVRNAFDAYNRDGITAILDLWTRRSSGAIRPNLRLPASLSDTRA